MVKKDFSHIKGVMFDLDGVFYIGDSTIEGSLETIERLRKSGLPFRFTTNTTTKSRATLLTKLNRLGLPIKANEVFSAPEVAIRYLRKQGSPSCFLCLNDDLMQDFSEFTHTDQSPDFVVIGDINDGWHYDLLNKMFRMIIGGAEIIALHKGRYWHEPDGLYLDIGAFVAGLEYTTSKQAMIIGKPSAAFFHLVAEDMGIPPQQVMMVGDDVVSDVGGAQKAGLSGVLVKTGKYRDELVQKSGVTPDAVIDSVASLPDLLPIENL
ncbi:MAG: TIGR01458 family HAD-type hydrolase [Candidatus Zixiibacteriota bacterium]